MKISLSEDVAERKGKEKRSE